MNHKTVKTAMFLVLAGLRTLVQGDGFSMPASIPDTESLLGVPTEIPVSPFGQNIQRTMGLLASADSENPVEVRILFYGQSIVQQGYVERMVITHLKKAYPHARIRWENRAIGGFKVPLLLRTAEADLYPYNPDLIIFHAYGGEEGELFELIRQIRLRTTADVLTWTHHMQPAEFLDHDMRIRLNRASELRLELARRFGVEVADVRQVWLAYLKAHRLDARVFLTDTIHPNALGGALMGQILLPHFIVTGEDQPDLVSSSVRTLSADGIDPGFENFLSGQWKREGRRWVAGKDHSCLSFTFTGSRVDLNTGRPTETDAGVVIKIDGKRPSELPWNFVATRTSPAPEVWWPSLLQIGLGEDPVEESWTLTFDKAEPEDRIFGFSVRGSLTGFDGFGRTDRDFVSDSGRIRILTRDWQLARALEYRDIPLPEGFSVSWSVRPRMADFVRLETGPASTNASSSILVHGLPSGRHFIELCLVSTGTVPVESLVLHIPPFRTKTEQTDNWYE